MSRAPRRTPRARRAPANKTIRALIILARVVCGDVYSDLHGTVIVHDRYVSYDHFDGVSHQLCTAHLLGDVEDTVQSYPDAIWPGQVAEALRGLIHAANLARDQGLAAVPGQMTAEYLTSFRRGVTVGLSQVRRVPGTKTKQPPVRLLLECLKNREADVLRFLSDTAIPPTSNQAVIRSVLRVRVAGVSRAWFARAGSVSLAGALRVRRLYRSGVVVSSAGGMREDG